jgi:hypothetical protein
VSTSIVVVNDTIYFTGVKFCCNIKFMSLLETFTFTPHCVITGMDSVLLQHICGTGSSLQGNLCCSNAVQRCGIVELQISACTSFTAAHNLGKQITRCAKSTNKYRL